MRVSVPHLILLGFLQVLQGGNTLNFSFKHTHVFLSTQKKKCLLLLHSYDRDVKEYISIPPLKISEQRFKSACSKLQADVNKAKASERGGRSWRYYKDEQSGILHGVVWEPFMWGFCPEVLCFVFFGKLVTEDEMTSCWILALLLQEFKMRKRAALIPVVIVVVNNIILIIVLAWEILGTTQTWNAMVWDCSVNSTNRSWPCSKL